jgi:hypothetical protein
LLKALGEEKDEEPGERNDVDDLAEATDVNLGQHLPGIQPRINKHHKIRLKSHHNRLQLNNSYNRNKSQYNNKNQFSILQMLMLLLTIVNNSTHNSNKCSNSSNSSNNKDNLTNLLLLDHNSINLQISNSSSMCLLLCQNKQT